MAMPGGPPGQMGVQQMLHHQQMVAQQQQAQAAAAQAQAAAAQQQMQQGMGPGPGMMVPVGGPSPHSQGIPAGHPHPQGPLGSGPGGQGPPGHPHPPQQGQGLSGPPSHPGQGQGHPQQHPGAGQIAPALDNISKAKSLVNPIKDSLSNVLRTAANSIYANNMVDSGSKPVDYDVTKFDRTLEEFFTYCDQMEVHLKTSIECISQSTSSQRYLPLPVAQNRMDGSLTYPQYIGVVKGQIAYAKEVHGTLTEASQKLTIIE